jgi:hypothetical protein
VFRVYVQLQAVKIVLTGIGFDSVTISEGQHANPDAELCFILGLCTSYFLNITLMTTDL